MKMRAGFPIHLVTAGVGVFALATTVRAESNTVQTYNDGGAHNVADDITVGDTGSNNSLDVSNSTDLSNPGYGLMGFGVGADGNSAVVTGGSSWSIGTHLWIGVSG